MKDLLLRGKPIAPGYAQGHGFLWGQGEAELRRRQIRTADVDEELARFRQALERSRTELQRLSERVQSELGSLEAEIFTAHLLFLEDPQFIEPVEDAVRNDLICAESAVGDAIDELVQILKKADTQYLREREVDLRDLRARVLRHLIPSDPSRLKELESQAVLVARELLPSDLLAIDRKHLAGIVTEVGGETGHAAILARALGVPAVTGIRDATSHAQADSQVLVNGETGEVVFEPTEKRAEVFALKRAEFERATRRALATDPLESVTQDGLRIQLHANIGREHEVELVAKHRLEGVGLFRTEYLFLDESEAPSLEGHWKIYRRVATALRGKPLVVRTLDLGGDKFPAFLAPRFEANPNLGIRGLRFSLQAAEDLFSTQIRAVLRLADKYPVSILLPMVLGASDMRAAVSLINRFAHEEGVRKLPAVGALIETPSAVFSVKDILRQADFISIGTNDLTQFILAADRNALATIDSYTVLHPSVLRAVRQIIRAATSAGKPVSVCGEAAADARIACLLIGLGIRILSMNPTSASRVRFAIRAMSSSALEKIAEAALASDSAEGVSSLLDEALGDPLEVILTGQAPAIDLA